MADELEQTEERMSFDREVDITNIRKKAEKFDKGQAGECFFCGEEFSRVITVEWQHEDVLSCGGCRDKRNLP